MQASLVTPNDQKLETTVPVPLYYTEVSDCWVGLCFPTCLPLLMLFSARKYPSLFLSVSHPLRPSSSAISIVKLSQVLSQLSLTAASFVPPKSTANIRGGTACLVRSPRGHVVARPSPRTLLLQTAEAGGLCWLSAPPCDPPLPSSREHQDAGQEPW